jgi:hypothetical protein
VTVKVNDLTVYEVLASGNNGADAIWMGKTPCHLVVQVDVGMPDGANGVGVRANYPANTNPRYALYIDQIDIYVPATTSSSAPLSASDQGSSGDTGALSTTLAKLLANDDSGASNDQAQLLVPQRITSTSDDLGRSADTASLSANGSAPSTLLTTLDQGASLDFGTLGNAPHYLTGLDLGQSSDTATLRTSIDLSIRPVVGTVTEELYARLGPYTVEDADYGLYAAKRGNRPRIRAGC